MRDSLIERLRRMSRRGLGLEASDLLREAADRIEADAARIKKLQALAAVGDDH